MTSYTQPPFSNGFGLRRTRRVRQLLSTCYSIRSAGWTSQNDRPKDWPLVRSPCDGRLPWADILSVWLVWFEGQTCRFGPWKPHETLAPTDTGRICQEAETSKRLHERDADGIEAQSCPWWRSRWGLPDLDEREHPGTESRGRWREPRTFAATIEACGDDDVWASTTDAMADGTAPGYCDSTSAAGAASGSWRLSSGVAI